MHLEYNILWIDNDIQNYLENGNLESLKSFLLDLGFIPNVVTLDDEAKLDEFIFKSKYNLIISDYNLNATTGDIIIQKIREKGLSTEILFYTAKTSYKNDPAVKERLAFIDRITFHIGRDTFLDKIEKLIKLTLDVLLEINATRGLVTAQTSELDVIIEELVIDLVKNKLKLSKEELDEIINHYVNDFLKKSPSRFLDKYNKIGFERHYHSIEASRKWHIFRELLKKINTDDVKEFLEVNKTYGDDVIDIRNKFAHSKTIEKDGKLFLSGYGPDGAIFEYSNEQCITIRKNLIKHRNCFNKLSTQLEKN